METMRCCVCSEYLEKDRIIITNPCSHFLCPECSCEFGRIWRNDGRKKKKCPMCRSHLKGNLFTKSFTCNMSKSSETSVFVWVPTGTYIRQNYEQDLIDNLTEGNLFKAFSAAFMLNHLPNDIDLSLCNEWETYYYEKARNASCCSCNINFEISVLFITICGHLYCTICAAFLRQKERSEALECTSCMAVIETGDSPVIFMRPL